VKFRSAQLTSELKVEQAQLTRLRSWRPNQNARLELKGQLNDGKLQFKGDFSPFGDGITAEGSVKLNGLTLTPFAQLIAADPSTLQGRMDADIRIQSKYSSKKGLNFDQTGALALKQARMRFGDVDFADENFTWDGTVQVKLPAASDELQIAVAGKLEGKGGSVNPTPEKLEFQHSGLNWNGKLALTQKTETADFTFEGALKLREFKIASGDLNLDEESLAWDGSVQIKMPSSAKALFISAAGQLAGTSALLNLNSQTLKLKDSGLNWNGKFAFDQKQDATDLNIDGGLKVGKLELATSNVNLAEESLSWDGGVQITMPSSADALFITATGQMDAKGLSLDSTSQNFKLQDSGLNWNGKLVFAQKPATSDYKLDGALKLRELKMATSDVSLSNKSLTWNGSLEFLMPENIEKHKLTTDGKLESERQVFTFSREKLNVEHGGLLWVGQFDFGLKNFTAGLAAQGDFSITDLAITDTQRKLRLLASKAVSLKSIKGDANTQFSVATARITGLDLVGQTGSPQKASLFSASELQVQTVKLEQLKKVSIESARIVAAKGVLHHKNDGRWLYIEDLTAFLADSGTSTSKKPLPTGTKGKPEPASKKADASTGIQIGSLEIVGDSVVHFEDETVSPAFRSELRLKEARLTGVNSYQPEQASPIILEAESRKYTRLKLQGNIQPFTERISMDLKGKIKALEMPPLSPYAVRTIGYNLISGEMDADIDLKIIVGQLEGEGDLKFYNPKIEAVDPEKLQNKEGSPIPLQSALKILRDKDDDVRLKIPISGDVSDPKFSFADAINQAVIKGLSIATLSYLKYMLGPYGTAIGIIELGVKVGAKALPGIRLEPVEFLPGASNLLPATTEYLDKVAAILKEKKDLRLRLCGWATENDRMGQREAAEIPAAPPTGRESTSGGQIDAPKDTRLPLTDEAMLTLAERRADLIENILVSQHGIKDKRIFICKPEIDKNPDAKPRVELVF
jgi:hypothetical protein